MKTYLVTVNGKPFGYFGADWGGTAIEMVNERLGQNIAAGKHIVATEVAEDDIPRDTLVEEEPPAFIPVRLAP